MFKFSHITSVKAVVVNGTTVGYEKVILSPMEVPELHEIEAWVAANAQPDKVKISICDGVETLTTTDGKVYQKPINERSVELTTTLAGKAIIDSLKLWKNGEVSRRQGDPLKALGDLPKAIASRMEKMNPDDQKKTIAKLAEGEKAMREWLVEWDAAQ